MRHTKKQLLEIGFLLLASSSFAIPALAAPPAAPAQSVAAEAAAEAAASYSLGVTFGGQLHHGGLKDGISIDALTKGIRDGLDGRTVTEPDKQRVALLLRSAKSVVSAKNKAAAREFLVKNAQVAGVTTTRSGLQYKVLEPGDSAAESPKPTDQVTVQYRGRLLNGTEFDSSYARGQAASFRVNSVIKGWQEALPLMKPGAKWQLFVPPELAYDTTTPATIPPGSLLVFDIQLVKISAPASGSDPAAIPPAKAATPAS
jgi:FKBP-type peptidyl-prolyl cis-trans isomerase FklB